MNQSYPLIDFGYENEDLSVNQESIWSKELEEIFGENQLTLRPKRSQTVGTVYKEEGEKSNDDAFDLPVLERREAEINRTRKLLEEEENVIKSKLRHVQGLQENTPPSSVGSPKKSDNLTDQPDLSRALMMMASSLERGPLPARELPKFGGDVLKFDAFMSEFNDNIGNRVNDASTKLNYLRSLCFGEAYEAIKSCVVIKPAEKGLEKAILILHDQFGQRHQIVKAHLNVLVSGPRVAENDPKALFNLWSDMNNCYNTLSSWCYNSDLENSYLLEGIFKRLPSSVHYDILHSPQFLRNKPLIGFVEMMDHVDRAAKTINTPFGRIAAECAACPQRSELHSSRGNENRPIVKLNSTTTSEVRSPTGRHRNDFRALCGLCNGLHFIYDCKHFRVHSSRERFDIAQEKRLCFRCLSPGHYAGFCPSSLPCQVCNMSHHTLLHFRQASTSLPIPKSQEILCGLNHNIAAEEITMLLHMIGRIICVIAVPITRVRQISWLRTINQRCRSIIKYQGNLKEIKMAETCYH
ncbi:uncharacterized protein LOC144751223 [Ciona intestinalis]